MTWGEVWDRANAYYYVGICTAEEFMRYLRCNCVNCGHVDGGT